MAFKFEKLEVWQRAVELSFQVRTLTQAFPKEEVRILTSQMKRAADSIALSIAEGSTGQTNAEFKQFIGYAIHSAIKVVTCLYLGRKRQLITAHSFQNLYADTERIVMMRKALRKSFN